MGTRQGLGFGVYGLGLGFRLQGLGFRVQGSGICDRVQGIGMPLWMGLPLRRTVGALPPAFGAS